MPQKHSSNRLHAAWVALAATGFLVLGLVLAVPAQAVAPVSIFGSGTPATAAAADPQLVELGVQFKASVPGKVTGVRFYKGPGNTGTHTGSLWRGSTRLATGTLTSETASGWQTLIFASPVGIPAGRVYTASYLAPAGHYAVDNPYTFPKTTGSLTAIKGTYLYGGGRPSQTYQASNYWVDVMFTPSGTAPPAPTPTTTAGQPTNTPPTTIPTNPPTVLALPRVPWEGGPDYYRQFPGSAGYTNPNVFPIAAWWASFDTDANVKWDKDHGINTYVQFNPNSPGNLLAPNGMFYINSGPMKNSSSTDPAWVGWWTDDEVDGRFNATEGPRIMQAAIDAQGGSQRFSYVNYTGFITADHSTDGYQGLVERYVNMVPGAVSVDGYYYTNESCDSPTRWDPQINAPDNAHCASSASYGNFIDNLRTRDKVDGKLQPLWGFVENGAPQMNGKYITPAQEAGAVWSMIRHEARGIIWFNQSFSGSCQSGNVIRDAQTSSSSCNTARVEGMKTVNRQVLALAPVLNTQSYAWDFKAAGSDTMLKVKDGSAYIFAGVALNRDPGARTFTLPAGITGTTVEVVNENRTIPVAGGRFTDNFAAEYTNHIYRITL